VDPRDTCVSATVITAIGVKSKKKLPTQYQQKRLKLIVPVRMAS
jgi:hypothetical protein